MWLQMLMVWALAGVSLALAQPAVAADGESAEFFEMRVRPLLAKECFACHTGASMGGLRMDSRESLLKGGDSGPAIEPGNPSGSLLMQAVRQVHERLAMPPTGRLTDEETGVLALWIENGAVWPETVATGAETPPVGEEYVISPEQRAFWSFQPVRKPPLPQVRGKAWPQTPVDHFILAKLEEEGLEPAPPAGKGTLLRRASFDLTGLPPTPREVDEFLSDSSPDAFAKAVDRLLASPHYGERWGRYWLDLARYADGKLGASRDTPYPNAFRYRDWVIRAFNEDMPYDQFVKGQIAGDLLPPEDREKLAPGLGFQALGPNDHDRVDVTAKVFLGLTVGCAQCHDHKYDPIPTSDYYSLLGVFKSSKADEIPLAPEEEVAAYKALEKTIGEKKEIIDDFVAERSIELGRMLARKASRYIVAAWDVLAGRLPDAASAAAGDDGLDAVILDRWIEYLQRPQREHPYLKPLDELLARGPERAAVEQVRALADEFQQTAIAIFDEKGEIDDRNYVALGGAKGVKDERTRQYTNLEFLDADKWYLWRDLASEPHTQNGVEFHGGVYYFGLTSKLAKSFETRGAESPTVQPIERFLSGEWREYLESLRAEVAGLEAALPPQYPYLHALADSGKPENARIAIRGDAENLGAEAPRRFLRILCDGEPRPFAQGSGRLELAEAIASADNALTARVMSNRVWQWHFGHGIVRTPSNFGQLGERPSHPGLLDYLAARFVESGWSVKALHREIMLSAAYALSTSHIAANFEKDPDNRLHWRANLLQRLDAEALRDAMLAVSGNLDRSLGGPPAPLASGNRRRTVYGLISRTTPDSTLSLFDFPNPNNTSDLRVVTVGPLQRLFFLNNSFVTSQATALADRLARTADGDMARIEEAYRLLFARPPTTEEIRLGVEFLEATGRAWAQYAQVLLSSSEFSTVN